MALEKSPPKSASSALNGAAIDIRASPASHRPEHKSEHKSEQKPSPSQCATYTVRGNESWIPRQDMENLIPNSAGDHRKPIKNRDAQRSTFKYLPKGCKLGQLVGEGAANAVFEFELPDGSGLYEDDTRLLLRVAKEPIEDDRPKFNYIAQDRYYRRCIEPLLGSYVMHQELVIVRESGMIDAINQYLKHNDKGRKEKFKGTSIGQSDWGFLVEDMRIHESKGLLVEFKPKWLSQSPSAPANAIRCRQCAKELHNYVMEPDVENPIPILAKPCPLTLGRDDSSRVGADSAYRMLPRLDKLGDADHLQATLNILRDEPAFKQLRAAQEENDKVGPLGADKFDENFSLAMTLRDCTCFAQLPRQAPESSRKPMQPLKVRFGDFDMKSPSYRLDYWKGLEEELINGGFYTAEWLYCGGSYYRPPTKCVLEEARDRRHGSPEVISIQNAGPDKGACISSGNTRASQCPKVYTVKTNAVEVQKCLEAHKGDAPRPTPEEENLLRGRLNGMNRA